MYEGMFSMYVCFYVCMYVCMYSSMYVFIVYDSQLCVIASV